MDLWSGMIRRHRQQRGLTQAQFAELAGVEQATVSRWERGDHRPDIAMQRRLRDLIGQPDRVSDRLIVHRTEIALRPTSLRRSSGELVAASASARSLLGRLPPYGGGDLPLEEDTVVRQWDLAVREGFFAGEIASLQGGGVWQPAAGGPVRRGEWVWCPVTTASGEVLLSSQFQTDREAAGDDGPGRETCEITRVDDLILG